MKLKAQLTVVSLDRYNVDGTKGGKLYTQSDEATDSPDAVGREVTSWRCEYDLIDEMKPYNEKFPMLCEVEYKFVKGAKKSTVPYVLSVKPLK